MILPLNVPYFLIGLQSQCRNAGTKNTSIESFDEHLSIVKKQQQGPDMQDVTEERKSESSKKTDKLIKKLEIKKAITDSLSGRNRQADSFTERRNILPNNINHILAYIQRRSKSQILVQKIIQKQKKIQTFTTKRFYCYQNYLKQKLHNHVNKDTLYQTANHLELNQEIFSVQEQLFYNRICRILINYYIRQLAKLKILSSARVKRTNKLDHLKFHRTLLQYLVGNFGTMISNFF